MGFPSSLFRIIKSQKGIPSQDLKKCQVEKPNPAGNRKGSHGQEPDRTQNIEEANLEQNQGGSWEAVQKGVGTGTAVRLSRPLDMVMLRY